MLAYKKVSAARIQKGFILINKTFEYLDNLTRNITLYRENLGARKMIISEIHIDPGKSTAPEDPIVYASPAVPQKLKAKKPKSKRKSKSPKKVQRSVETSTMDIISKESNFTPFRY